MPGSRTHLLLTLHCYTQGTGERNVLNPFPLQLTQGAGDSLLRKLWQGPGIYRSSRQAEHPLEMLGPRSSAKLHEVVGRSVTTKPSRDAGKQIKLVPADRAA